jgi:predicted dehydrogenase
METPQPRVALVGLGRIASLLEDDAKREKPASHAGAFAAAGALLVGGYDTDAERRQLFSARWNAPTDFADAADLMARTRPDVVVVATLPDTHPELVELACEAGVPVVVCEKPVAADLGAAQRLERRVDRHATKVMVNHERRYARDYARVRQVIADGRYGALRTIHAQVLMGRGRTPAEVLWWDGTHMVDLLRFLTGSEVGTVQRWGRPHQPGGRLINRLAMGDVEVFVETAADRDHFVFELDLWFERGRIRVGNGLYEEFVGAPSPLYEKMRSLVPVAVEPGELTPTEYFVGMARDAVKAAQVPAYRPTSTLSDGLAALTAIKRMIGIGSAWRRRS